MCCTARYRSDIDTQIYGNTPQLLKTSYGGVRRYSVSIGNICRHVRYCTVWVGHRYAGVRQYSTAIENILWKCTALQDTNRELVRRYAILLHSYRDIFRRCTALKDMNRELIRRYAILLRIYRDIFRRYTALKDTNRELFRRCAMLFRRY